MRRCRHHLCTPPGPQEKNTGEKVGENRHATIELSGLTSRRRQGYRFANTVGQVADSTLIKGHPLSTPEIGKASSTSPSDLDASFVVGNLARRTFGRGLLDELHIEGYSFGKWTAFEELTDQQCLEILDHYKRLVGAVPFALLLPDLPPEDLKSKCPLLLLSVLLTASSSYLEIQKQADEIFRHVLADRSIIKGQRSLELFKGLVTYLTWYHHRFDPETQQFYQLLQMSTAMAADLSLSKKFAEDNGTLQSQSLDDLNNVRAFLLCYYLNCGGAVLGYDRLENMHCIRSLRNAAHLLARSLSQPLDTESTAIIELMYIAAQHRTSLNGMENREPSQIPSWSSESALRSWRDKYLHAQSPCVVRSSYHYISTYSRLKRADSTPPSPADIAACLKICQAQLSNVLQEGPTYLTLFGIVEWAPILTYLFLLPRLEASVTTASTSASMTDLTPRTTKMLERLRLQVAELKATAQFQTTLGAHHFFMWLEIIFSASERCTLSLQKAHSRQSPGTPVDGGGSAYELIHSYTDDAEDGLTSQPRESLRMERFWDDFMSDWLQW
ncbi:hypothetical protein A1O3_06550 [Capronia epimyces CBS 606.96]|uniref:Transcription factor domain-containing protein n=1 Tax=Capronia epimyces CBS 606.96 TaxID=1182542 RepID=W9XZC0_9EURO|nr:uncharacterized protein A1O3_06550 [Capronia epimyces CBS 606.96]EXJ82735.1 hypothetical protein A1O3_06550 [Capronia epimyces CBS 606.96]